MTSEIQIRDAEERLSRALLSRSIKMKRGGDVVGAVAYLEAQIAQAGASVSSIEIPAHLNTPFVQMWFKESSFALDANNKLLIPSAADPLVNCEAFAREIENLHKASDAATPEQPNRKRKLEAPNAPIANREAVDAGAELADENGAAQQSRRRIIFSGPESSPESNAEEPARRENGAAIVAEWKRREKNLEKELLDALASLNEAQSEDVRLLRQEKVEVARRNYRSAVRALEMAETDANVEPE